MNTDTTTPPARGYKTTEFWLALLGTLMLSAAGFLETIDASWAAIAVTVLIAVYNITRGGVKKTAANAARNAPLFLLCLSITALVLSSCAGTITYRHAESGAKGGLLFTPEKPWWKPDWFLKAPVEDDAGNEVDVELNNGK